MFLYFWWRVALALFTRIPLWLAYLLVAIAADTVYLCWPNGRRAMRENMRRIFGPGREREADRAARRSLRNYFYYIVDLSRLQNETPEAIERRIIFDGWQIIDEAFRPGKGVVLALMHFGFWEVGGAAMAQHGYPMNVVAETFSHPQMNELIQGLRVFRGMKVIPLEKAASRVIRALRANEVVALLIDRPVPGAGVSVRFFDAETEIPSGAARIALKTGAPILAVSLLRVPGHRILGIVEPIPTTRTGDDQADIRAVTQAIVSAHERVIRRHPDQWFMFRRMWPARPRQLEPALQDDEVESRAAAEA